MDEVFFKDDYLVPCVLLTTQFDEVLISNI